MRAGLLGLAVPFFIVCLSGTGEAQIIFPQAHWKMTVLTNANSTPQDFRAEERPTSDFATDIAQTLADNGLDVPNSAFVIGHGIGGGFSIFYAQVLGTEWSPAMYRLRHRPHISGINWRTDF